MLVIQLPEGLQRFLIPSNGCGVIAKPNRNRR